MNPETDMNEVLIREEVSAFAEVTWNGWKA